ncbi:uncharacterized protein LOC117103879 isoform X2 [Anneissia japonica]|uniref:uncharacterized protein LOC117103879 isoform X2 n=1 Tax=Anneissia japonica TaxID=1529436 RepID=UPI001425B52B|nr:uncharacterized protein LOC117103879 isoform X2 [Anneissia japonica]
MACFKAKFDYEKERDDVLSFKKGDLFEVTSKVDDRWWAARAESDNSVGYVPALYLEPVKDKPIGRLVPEGRIDTKEHDYHLEALAELQSKVRPLPDELLQRYLNMKPQRDPSKKINRPVEKGRSKSVPNTKIPPVVAVKKNRGLSVQLEQKCDNIPEVDYDDAPENNDESDPNVPIMAVRPTVQNGKHARSATYNGTLSTDKNRNDTEPPSTKTKPREKSAKHSRSKTVDAAYDRNANSKLPEKRLQTGDNTLPYHHQCNVVRDKGDEKDGGDEDEDEIPSFLSLPPPQEPPPPPDYDLNDEDILNEEGVPYHHQLNKTGRDSSSDDGQPTSPVNRAFLPADDNPVLIQAKPLPNPVKGSRMHKDLHFELKHSGRDVLKPELARVMTQRKHQKSKAELDAEKKAKRTSLEIKLQERQEILKQKDEKLKIPGEAIPEEEGQSELYRVRASLKSKEAAKT